MTGGGDFHCSLLHPAHFGIFPVDGGAAEKCTGGGASGHTAHIAVAYALESKLINLVLLFLNQLHGAFFCQCHQVGEIHTECLSYFIKCIQFRAALVAFQLADNAGGGLRPGAGADHGGF